MWVKLTSHDGKPITVNFNSVSNYYEHVEAGGNTFIEFKDSEEDVFGVQVRETIEQLDKITKPVSIDIPDKW